ncbi:MAG: hypothetical protein LBQ88_00645 [Treponema sp.]|jgi:predicted transposase/invertase (TIGR01784 family)|nr:hypothetical protein [Treponema sp.]
MILNELTNEYALAAAREDGIEEGREIGIEKGREEQNKAVAKNALNNGIPVEMIQRITGMDIAAINSLIPQ